MEESPLGAFGSSRELEPLGAQFQPVVSLRTGRTFGFAAIPHCVDGDAAQVEELFARAAFEKRVGELGRSVRGAALAECAGMPVFISVHPHELKESWLIRPDDPLCSHDAQVFLQISQSAYSPMCLHVLTEVSSRSGISLILDDFGSNTSSLCQMVELCPAFVKLTEELVQGIDVSARKRVVVAAIVQMCMDLGAQVIAKGIETQREVTALMACGVAYGQGTIMGPPTHLPQASTWKMTR